MKSEIDKAASVKPIRELGLRNGLHDPTAELLRNRHRAKRIRFIVCELLALALMVGSGLAALTSAFASESLTPLFRILPITAAAAATIIPILFYGSAGRRPRG